MNNQFFMEILKNNLNGDCSRIIMFIVGSNKQVRLYEIEEALGLSKCHVSNYCRKLYKLGILKRYNIVKEKRVYPMYSINWNYQFMEVNDNETI